MKFCLIDAGGDCLLGVPAPAVVELCRELPLTPVPLSPPVLGGIADLHGEILPVFRSSRIFPGATEFRRSGIEPKVVVLRGEHGRFGLRIRQADLVQLKDLTVNRENEKKSDETEKEASHDAEFLDELSATGFIELTGEQATKLPEAEGFEGIYRRTLDVENRGLVRELDLPALSRRLQETLMAFDVPQTS